MLREGNLLPSEKWETLLHIIRKQKKRRSIYAIQKTILSITALFMTASGMPVYAEQAPPPEVTERKDDAAASTETESVLGIKKLYAEEPEMLTTGTNFNAAIKTLATGSTKGYSYWDFLINTVQVADALPSGASTSAEIESSISSGTMKDVSNDNDRSYLAWWDADAKTIYLYSKSGDIVLNPDSGSMFSYCTRLTTLDASKWNTSRVTRMSSMFSYCSSLTTLDVSGWNTRQVTDMNHMFSYCSSLATLGVSKWDTSKVTDMSNMFQNCSKLATLDVSNWNTSKVTSMRYMFESCGGLKYIYIGSNWNTDNVTSSTSMFIYCSNLPNYNSGVVDKTNAHAGSGGYMTLKS